MNPEKEEKELSFLEKSDRARMEAYNERHKNGPTWEQRMDDSRRLREKQDAEDMKTRSDYMAPWRATYPEAPTTENGANGQSADVASNRKVRGEAKRKADVTGVDDLDSSISAIRNEVDKEDLKAIETDGKLLTVGATAGYFLEQMYSNQGNAELSEDDRVPTMRAAGKAIESYGVALGNAKGYGTLTGRYLDRDSASVTYSYSDGNEEVIPLNAFLGAYQTRLQTKRNEEVAAEEYRRATGSSSKSAKSAVRGDDSWNKAMMSDMTSLFDQLQDAGTDEERESIRSKMSNRMSLWKQMRDVAEGRLDPSEFGKFGASAGTTAGTRDPIKEMAIVGDATTTGSTAKVGASTATEGGTIRSYFTDSQNNEYVSKALDKMFSGGKEDRVSGRPNVGFSKLSESERNALVDAGYFTRREDGRYVPNSDKLRAAAQNAASRRETRKNSVKFKDEKTGGYRPLTDDELDRLG